MSYEFYKILHIAAILLVYSALGGAALLGGQGAAKGTPDRKRLSIIHGVGLLIAFVAGFGLMARLGMARDPFPLWIWLKIAIWVATGGALVLAYRMRQHYKLWAIVFPLLGATAAALAILKPGMGG